jgi:DNA polymerase-3 subunit alpha
MLRSSARIENLIQKAKELGQSAIALTDHDNMFGMLEFYFSAQKAKIKPILGCHIHLEPLDSSGSQKNLNDSDRLVLLAENNHGYENLVRIVSHAYLPERFDSPIVKRAFLEKNSGGLIALYGDPLSSLAKFFLKGDIDQGQRQIDSLIQIFGPASVYLMLQHQKLVDQNKLNQKIADSALHFGIETVATNNVHYLSKEDCVLQQILRCVDENIKLENLEDPEFPTAEFYLKSSEEMNQLFTDNPMAINNTLLIAERCNVEIQTDVKDTYWPKFKIDPKFKDSDDFLAHLTWSKIGERYTEITPTIKERVQFELEVMKTMKVAGYMLIVQDFINWARGVDIPVGPGRGSAVGSIVSYIIGITDIDPLKFDLLFERFLNPERVSMPDIDTDFSDLDRSKVIDYVTDKYGEECVAQIVTYGRMKAKMVIRDVGRTHGIEMNEINRIAKLIPPDIGMTLEKAMETSEDLRTLIHSREAYKDLWNHSTKLEGLVRQSGIHAAAVIIAPGPLSNLAPIYKAKDANKVIQYDKKYAEEIGLLKMDFLGLRTLSVIKDSLLMIKENHRVNIDILHIDQNDTQTYDLISKGYTVGVFQFESPGMQEYLRKLKPSCLEDMIAMNALYRPGPIGNIPSFIKRKHGSEQIDCFHQNLEPVLGDTYGIIVYQEQVMRIAQILAGFSLGGADIMRRIMAKKNKDKLAELQPEFFNGALERGYKKELITKIWETLIPFCDYAFNKSHSAAYAFIGYQTAWLKAHYGPEFMAANMSSELTAKDRLVILITECRKLNIKILHPDINSSFAKFTAHDDKITYGLAGIKNVGEKVINLIVAEREKNGPYKSLFDLCNRTAETKLLNRKTLESLIMAGALDHLPGSRAEKYASVDKAMAIANRKQEDEAKGQISMFDLAGQGTTMSSQNESLENIDAWTYRDLLNKEKDVLGLYVSGHPLEEYKDVLKGFTTCSLESDTLRNLEKGSKAVLGGVVKSLRGFPSKRDNKVFGVALIEDFNGENEIFLEPEIFNKIRDRISVDSMILVKGTTDIRDDKVQLKGESVIAIEDAIYSWGRYLHLSIDTKGLVEQTLINLKESIFRFDSEADGRGVDLIVHFKTQSKYRHTLKVPNPKVIPDPLLLKELRDMLGEENVWVSDKL